MNILFFIQLIFNSIFLIIIARLVSLSNSTKRGKKVFEFVSLSFGVGYLLLASMLYY